MKYMNKWFETQETANEAIAKAVEVLTAKIPETAAKVTIDLHKNSQLYAHVEAPKADSALYLETIETTIRTVKALNLTCFFMGFSHFVKGALTEGTPAIIITASVHMQVS